MDKAFESMHWNFKSISRMDGNMTRFNLHFCYFRGVYLKSTTMKNFYRALAAGLAMLLTFTLNIAQAQSETNIVPGELIVQLDYQRNVQQLIKDVNMIHPNVELEVERSLASSINVWLLTFNDLEVQPDEVREMVNYHRDVVAVQFNHNNVTLRDSLPNDPQLNQQWAFVNTDTFGSGGNAGISAGRAWEITTGGTTAQGDQIVVAVIDGGFYIQHEDINFWSNAGEIPGNGQDDDGNGYVDDVNGWNAYNNSGNVTSGSHGTHVAGTVAATGNNSIGVTGVNWNAQVMAIQGSSGNEATVVAAYGYALDNRRLYDQTNGAEGAFVVSTNSSFGVDFGNPANYPIWCNFFDSLGHAGILSCGATANNSVNIDAVGDVPTACGSDYLISVTNTNSSDQRGSAGYGATTIDLAAPGTGILSTYPNDNYQAISGTSMATPHVAGTVALMISAGCDQFIEAYKMYPDSMALVIKQMIMDNVDPVPGLQGECVTGGRLNLYYSVKAVADWVCSPLVLMTSTNDATCGNNDGTATVNVTGNSGPMTYLWDDPMMQTGQTATGLAAGNYTVTVTDSAGNMNDIMVTVINGNEPTVSVAGIDLDCFGDASGEATANVSGGTPAFTYSWDDPSGQSTQTATGLDAGTYTVTVSDGAGCVVTSTVEIVQPTSISVSSGVSANTTDPSNGSIMVNTSGGTPPYSFSWDNGATTEDLTGLFQGQYVLTITDANGCTRVDTFNVGGNVGFDELDASLVMELYPNPSEGVVSLAFEGAVPGDYVLTVFNSVGMVVQEKQVTWGDQGLVEIDLTEEAEGFYYLSITNAQQQVRTLPFLLGR